LNAKDTDIFQPWRKIVWEVIHNFRDRKTKKAKIVRIKAFEERSEVSKKLNNN